MALTTTSIAADIATELIADSVVRVIKLVTDRSSNLELQNASWDYDKTLKQLKDKAVYIEAFFQDIGRKGKNEAELQLVCLYIQELRDVAYLIQEVFDDDALETHRKTKLSLGRRVQGKLKNLKSTGGFHAGMSRKVAEILTKFEELDKKAKTIGINQVDIARRASDDHAGYHCPSALDQVRKHAAASSSEFCGREVDEKKLLEVICNPSYNEVDLSIIAIVGIGGLGKTTLAKHVYDHEEVDRYFDMKKAWICVFKNFVVERFLKEMVESLTLSNCELTNTGALIKKLETELKGKKFLLVLDDVWNVEKELWDSFKNELQRIGNLPGSVILITTRSKEVVKASGSVYAHTLGGLSEDDSWALLKDQAFSNEPLPLPYATFEEVGRKIVEKCKGVPLVIKVMGSLLKSKKHLSQWESIEKSELLSLQQDNQNTIISSLLLSFNHLPSPALKQCFAYCAIFPKGSLMQKGQLISLWLSQGIIFEHETSSSTELTTGGSCIQVLVSNSLLEEIEDDENDEIVYFTMHDLVHDLAHYVLQNELLVWKKEAQEFNKLCSYRHLIFNFEKNDVAVETPTEAMIQKLRTVSVWSGMLKCDLLTSATYLRTLIMANIGLTDVPSSIEYLKHLRYLDLSGNEFQTLPESVCKLYQLQTLILLHCFSLTKLPKKLRTLLNLRHILTSNSVLATRGSLQPLTSLQTLPLLELRNGAGWTIDELKNLQELKGEICIKHLEYVKGKSEAREAGLFSKKKILKLKLMWGQIENRVDGEDNDEDVLDGLEPHPYIKSLNVTHFNGDNFPSWMKTMVVKEGLLENLKERVLENLRVVELCYCCRCQHLPTLGQLCSLEILKLENFDCLECIGKEFYQGDQNTSQVLLFPALKLLRMYCLRKLMTWESPPKAEGLALTATAFPHLETLEIESCQNLKTIPALKFPSLRHLSFEDVGGTQPLDIIKYNHGLNSLKVSKMSEIISLPQELLLNGTNLQILEIQDCDNLVSFPTGMQQPFAALKKLRIINCRALSSLSEDLFHGAFSLHELVIEGCERLRRIPASLTQCTSLEHLWVKNCPYVQKPAPDISNLQGLLELTVVKSGKLMTSVLQSIPNLHCLQELDIGGFEDDKECSNYFYDMTAALCSRTLKRLILRDCPKVNSLPQQLHFFTSIKHLHIESFGELQQLPEWIGNLSSLEELELRSCHKLKDLPSEQTMRGLSRLHTLHIYKCPLLERRYRKGSEPEWVKNLRCFPFLDDHLDAENEYEKLTRR